MGSLERKDRLADTPRPMNSPMNSKVDLFLKDGCGRCSFYQTPQCKVRTWREELVLLRDIVLESELEEGVKWSQPCYTLKGKNVLMLVAFKHWCGISFFKGALLRDEHGLLHRPGDNSHSERVMKFTDAQTIGELTAIVHQHVAEAIALERAGAKVPERKHKEPVPEELRARLDSDAEFNAAFAALTPGRQRSYILHIGQARQAKTRVARVEKCMPKIFRGKGFNER